MSNRVQYRRDTKARWAEVNPVLMEGEIGLETDTKNIKMGDGEHAWNELEYGVGIENITSELGDSENLAASQKLVTNSFNPISAICRGSLIFPKKISYDSYLTHNPCESGYWLSEYFLDKIRNKKIFGICLNFNKIGTFSIFKGTGIKTSSFSKTLIKKINIIKTGWNVINFEEPFAIAENEYLGFTSIDDTALLNIANIDADNNYLLYYYFTDKNQWSSTNVRDLMLFVIGDKIISSSISEIEEQLDLNSNKISEIELNLQTSPYSIFDNSVEGLYFDINGGENYIHNIGIIGKKISLKEYNGCTIKVLLGTEKSAYIVITNDNGDVLKTYQSLTEPMIFKVTSEMGYLLAGGYAINEKQDVMITLTVGKQLDLNSNKISEIELNLQTSPYSKMITFGDSITAGYNTEEKWGDILSKRLKCNYINYAVSGYQTISMITKIDTADSDADLIFFFGGTNDWALGNVDLGEMFIKGDSSKEVNFDTSTFFGRINLAAKKLLSKYPSSIIYFITPLHRKTYKNQYANDLTPNGVGLYLEQYVDAIETSGKYFSIPVINLWHNSGLNPNIDKVAEKYFNHSDGGIPDKLHPDKNGHKRISDLIYKIII